MHLVMTLLVRDEADIIRSNLEAHLALGVDRFVVTDNRSEDATPEILREYERAGIAYIIDEQGDDYDQARWVTRMARLAASELGADWVINSDADEFWLPEQDDIKAALTALPSDVDVLVAHRSDFVPRPDDGRPFFDRMLVRKVTSLNAIGRPLPPKVCHRARVDIEVAQGNHTVTAPSIGAKVDDGRIDIAHFPMRTYEQFARKIASGGAAYARNQELPPSVGGTWRHLYGLLQRDELADWYASNELTDAAVDVGLADGSLLTDTRVRDLVHTRRRALRSGQLPYR